MEPFIGKLLSSTLLWCCLFFNFTQFVVLENLSILDLAFIVRTERLKPVIISWFLFD